MRGKPRRSRRGGRHFVAVLYSLIVVGQLLVGLVAPLLIFVPSYLGWRTVDKFRSSRQRSTDSASEREQRESPIETVKRRYAEGELSGEEFERKIEQLVDVSDRAKGHEGDSRATEDSSLRE